MIAPTTTEPATGSLFVETVLLPCAGPSDPPRLSDHAIDVLNRERPRLQVPHALIERSVALPMEEADQAVTVGALRHLREDRIRHAQERICGSVLELLEKMAVSAAGMEDSIRETAKGCSTESEVVGTSAPRLGWRAFPLFLRLILSVVLVVVSLVVIDLVNGASMLKFAGQLEELSWLELVCRIAPNILGVFVGLAVYQVVLGPLGRSRAARVIMTLLLPLCLFSLATFSISQGSEIDVFTERSIPTWLTTFLSILSGAGCAWYGKLLYAKAAATIFGLELTESNELRFYQDRVNRWDNRSRQAKCLRHQLQALRDELAAERQEFIGACLLELHAAQACLREMVLIAQARARLQSLPTPPLFADAVLSAEFPTRRSAPSAASPNGTH